MSNLTIVNDFSSRYEELLSKFNLFGNINHFVEEDWEFIHSVNNYLVIDTKEIVCDELEYERCINEIQLYIDILEAKLNDLYARKNNLSTGLIRYRTRFRSFKSECQKYFIVAMHNAILDLLIDIESEEEFALYISSGVWSTKRNFSFPRSKIHNFGAYITELELIPIKDFYCHRLMRKEKPLEPDETLNYKFSELKEFSSSSLEADFDNVLNVKELTDRISCTLIPFRSEIKLDGQCVH